MVLHLAWRDGFVHNSPAHIEDLPAHYHFIENLLEGGCTHLAVMGSMHEVGYWEGAIDENSACNPASLYGISKNALRQITSLLTAKHGATMQWLRGYYIVGDDAHGSSIFSKLLDGEEVVEVLARGEGEGLLAFLGGATKIRQILAAVDAAEE